MAEEHSPFDIPESEITTPEQPSSEPVAVASDRAPSVDADDREPAPAASEAPTEAEPEAKTVPLAALHEERERRRALEEQQRLMEDRFQEFRQRMESQMASQKPPEEPEYPGLDDDPVTNLDFRLKQQEEAFKQQQAASQQQQQLETFTRSFQMREQQFASENPDYYQAVDYLRQQRSGELQLMGYNQQQAAQIVDAEAVNYAVTMTQNGVDPVAAFYQTAAQRGYKSNAPAPTAEGNVNLQQLSENISRAQSVGPSGTPSTEGPTLAELAEMSDDEFDRATSGDSWKKLWA